MRRNIRTLMLVCFLTSCGTSQSPQSPQSPSSARSGGARPAPPVATRDERPVILFVGTSLTAGLGVDPESAYPAVIQRRIDSLGMQWHVVNAGLSGETSAGALRRIPWLLRDSVGVFVLETGANDGLRGLDVDTTRANIEAIVRQVRARYPATPIVLVGMEAPPNMGAAFTSRFHSVFPEIARRDTLALVPFLLTGVAGIDTLNQGDGIHPTPRGHRIVAENVWRVLGPVLQRQGARAARRTASRTG